MRTIRANVAAWLAAAAICCAGALDASPAAAQTRADCEQGIASMRKAMDAAADDATRKSLAKYLKGAERELGETQYDECMDYVNQAVSENLIAAPEFQPNVTGQLKLELQDDLTYRRRGGRTTNDLFTDSEYEMQVNLTPFFSIGSHVHAEPVREPPDGNRVFGDTGLYLEELFAKFEWEIGGVRVGKFDPAFGSAHEDENEIGIYSKNFAEDSYELDEGLGFNPFIKFKDDLAGKYVIGVSIFKFDTTILSNSMITSPRFDDDRTERVGRNRVRFGGPGNTGTPTSVALSVEADDVLGIDGLGYNLGFHRLSRGRVQGDRTQTGFVAGLNYDGEIAPKWRLKGIAEAAYLHHFQGTRVNNLVPTLGLQATYDKAWHVYSSYSQMRRESTRTILVQTDTVTFEDDDDDPATPDVPVTDTDTDELDIRNTVLDRIYSIGIGYSFDFGLRLDTAWVRRTTDHDFAERQVRDGVGFRAHYDYQF